MIGVRMPPKRKQRGHSMCLLFVGNQSPLKRNAYLQDRSTHERVVVAVAVSSFCAAHGEVEQVLITTLSKWLLVPVRPILRCSRENRHETEESTLRNSLKQLQRRVTGLRFW